MFMMEKKEVQSEINKINHYLSKCLWMDFTFTHSNWGKIELYGAIDQTYNNYIDNYEIRIDFEFPHMVQSLFSWGIDDSKSFIELLKEEETFEFNLKYQVEQGNYIFRINADGFEEAPIIIASKKIKCIILNPEPFK